MDSDTSQTNNDYDSDSEGPRSAQSIYSNNSEQLIGESESWILTRRSQSNESLVNILQFIVTLTNLSQT